MASSRDFNVGDPPYATFTLSQQLSQVCPGTTYNFSMYVGMYDAGGVLPEHNVFQVTLGDTQVIPVQSPCTSPGGLPCPLTASPGAHYRYISAMVVPTTTSPILQIEATFEAPNGTHPAEMLVDLVLLTVI
jgi:hypothetical protein